MSFYRMRGFGDDGDFTLPDFNTTSAAGSPATDGTTIPNSVMMDNSPGPDSGAMGPNTRNPAGANADGPGSPMGSQAQYVAGQGMVPPTPGATAGAPPLVSIPANTNSGTSGNSGSSSFLSSAQGMLNIFGQAVGSHPATYAVPLSTTPTWILPVVLIGGVALVGLVLVSTHKSPAMGRYGKRRSKR